MIREMTSDDSSGILDIYKMGIDSRNSTFETEVPSWAEWDSMHLKHSRFVYMEDGKIVGWIALSSVSARKVYNGVAEVSVYVDKDYLRKGIGSMLIENVIQSSEDNGIWTLYSSIFQENTATVKLHIKFGFRIIGTREKIAKLVGKWRDTLLLERRSTKAGI